MKSVTLILIAVIVAGCTRTVYLPAESEHAETVRERVVAKVADTVVVAERCTLKMMPEGMSSVVHREVQHFRVVHDTVNISHADTVRVVNTVSEKHKPPTPTHGKWVWIAMGCAATLAVISVSRKILRRFL